MEDPVNRQPITEISLFVKGIEDSNFTLLKKISSTWPDYPYDIRTAVPQFFDMFKAETIRAIVTGRIFSEGEEYRTVYKLKEEWTSSEKIELEIAKIFSGQDKTDLARLWQERAEGLPKKMSISLQEELMLLTKNLNSLNKVLRN